MTPLSNGPTTYRLHLRLVHAPAARLPGSRLWQGLQAGHALLVLGWATLRSWLWLLVAFSPLALRRAPVGRRLRPLAPREARVIPFQPPRTALPR